MQRGFALLFNPFNKMVAMHYLKIFCKPFIKWVGLFTKMLINQFSKLGNVYFAVKPGPYKAAHFI